jgi:hypothetical protein
VPGQTGKPQKPSVRITGFQAEILTWDLPNTKQEYHSTTIFGLNTNRITKQALLYKHQGQEILVIQRKDGVTNYT